MTEPPNHRELDTCDNCKHVIYSNSPMAFPRGCSLYKDANAEIGTVTVCDSFEE